MSSPVRVTRDASRRLRAFNTAVWVIGVAMVLIIGITTFATTPVGGDAEGRADAYRYDPWNNPTPALATAEGDGVYNGVDGEMIALDGLDPDKAVLVEVLDRTYVGEIVVTGAGGSLAGSGASPARFDGWIYSTDSMYLLAPGVRAELWVDGLSDERWRLRVSQPDLPEASGVVSGIGLQVVRHSGGATTARVSGRGEGRLTLTAVTRSGATELLYADGRFDQSVAWPDSTPVILVFDAYSDKGWSMTFDEPSAPADSPTTGPTASPSPAAGGGGADG